MREIQGSPVTLYFKHLFITWTIPFGLLIFMWVCPQKWVTPHPNPTVVHSNCLSSFVLECVWLRPCSGKFTIGSLWNRVPPNFDKLQKKIPPFFPYLIPILRYFRVWQVSKFLTSPNKKRDINHFQQIFGLVMWNKSPIVGTWKPSPVFVPLKVAPSQGASPRPRDQTHPMHPTGEDKPRFRLIKANPESGIHREIGHWNTMRMTILHDGALIYLGHVKGSLNAGYIWGFMKLGIFEIGDSFLNPEKS